MDQEIKMSKTSVYSKHQSFKPSERIKFRFSKALRNEYPDYLEYDSLKSHLDDLHRGKLVFGSTFFFCNNHVHLRFGQSNIIKVCTQDLTVVFNSVRRQDMTKDEIIEFALLMGSVWSLIFRKNVSLEKVLAGYYTYAYRLVLKLASDKCCIPLREISVLDFLEEAKNVKKSLFLPKSYTVKAILEGDFDFTDCFKNKHDLYHLVNHEHKFKYHTLTDKMFQIENSFYYPRTSPRTLVKREYTFTEHFPISVNINRDEEFCFISCFISKLEITSDLGQIFKEMIQWVKEEVRNFELTVSLIENMIQMNVIDYYDSSLKFGFKELRKIEFSTSSDLLKAMDKTSDQLDFANTVGRPVKSYLRLKQAIMDQWTLFFGLKKFNHVYTLNSLMDLTIFLIEEQEISRGIKNCTLDDEEPCDSKDSDDDIVIKEIKFDDTTFCQKILNSLRSKYENFKQPYQELKDKMREALDSAKDGADGVKSCTERMNSLFDEFSGKISHQVAAKMIFKNEFSFSSVASGFESVKLLINSIFSSVVEKLFGLLGLNVEGQIPDATHLFMVYLVWVNTESDTLKMLLVIDLATTMGVVDYIFDILKQFWGYIKDKVGTINTGFDDYLEQEGKSIKAIYGKYSLTKELTEDKIETDEELTTKSEDWLTIVKNAIKVGSPFVLGSLAVVVLGKHYLGSNDKKSVESIGSKVIATARNLSFLSLGLAAMPKIMENSLLVINFVVDYAKNLVLKKHKTRLQKRDIIKKFLIEANYDLSYSPIVFASDPTACLIFLEHYSKLKEIREYLIDVADANLTRHFFETDRRMNQLYTIARSALKMLSSNMEPCHIQLHSAVPGIGKTDTVVRLVEEAKAALNEHAQKFNVKDPYIKEETFGNQGVMYFNDTLSYADMYYYQAIGVFDEMNVFKNPDPESVVQKMVMLSGNPCIVNKAAIEDKGMTYDTRVFFSSTNTSYPQIDGMLEPKAYHRRRLLFDVEVKPEFLNSDKQPDWDRINSSGQRSRAGHLRFRWMNSVADDSKKLLPNPEMEDYMDINQFTRFVGSKIRKHLATEDIRMRAKDPAGYRLKKHLEIINATMTSIYKKKPTVNSQKVSQLIDSAIRAIEEEKDVQATLPDLIKAYKEQVGDILKENSCFSELFQEFVTKWTRDTMTTTDFANLFDAIVKREQSQKEHSHEIEINSGPTIGCDLCKLKELKLLILNYRPLFDISGLGSVLTNLPLVDEIKIQNTSEDWDLTFLRSYELTRKRGLWVIAPTLTQSNRAYVNFDNVDYTKFEMTEGKILVNTASESISELEKEEILSFMVYYSYMFGNQSLPLEKYKRKYLLKMKLQSGRLALKERLKLLMITVEDNVRYISRWVFDLFKDAFKFTIYFTAAVSTFYLLQQLGRLLVGTTHTSYNERTRGLPMVRHQVPPPITRVANTSSFEPNLQYDFTEDVKSMQKFLFRIFLLKGDALTIRTRAMALSLGGSVFIAPRHFFDKFDGNENIAIYDHVRAVYECKPIEKFYRTQISLDNVRFIEGCDAAVFEIKGFRAVASAEKHFLKESDLENNMINFSYVQAMTVYMREKSRFVAISDFNHNNTGYKYGDTGYAPGVIDELFGRRKGTSIKVDRVIRITPSSQDKSIMPGDSGSPVLHSNTKMQSRFILGIAFCKDDFIFESYYCNVVTQEQIAAAKAQLSFSSVIETCFYESEELSNEHQLYQVFENKAFLRQSPIRTLDISKTSGYKKSPIHGVFKVESQPAIQEIHDPRIPDNARHFLKVSLNKYNGDTSFFMTNEQAEEMKWFLKKIYNDHFNEFLPTLRVYTPREAITGIRMVGSTPINYHTSAGLPYSIEPGVKGKTPFIKFDESQYSIYVQDRVYFDVSYYENSYLNGKIPHNFKSEYRKKELVGENKILEPKTRTIATGNMIHQIIYNRVNKDLMTKIKNLWNQGKTSPYALGIDMEKHADLIAEHLRWHDYIFDFDVKAWERSINLQLCLMVIENRAEFVQQAYRQRKEKVPYDLVKVMEALTVDFIDTDVIYADVLFHKTSGLLSGHPGTFMENSDIHAVLILQIVYEILKMSGYPNPTKKLVSNNVRFLVAADDIVLSVAPNLRPYITAQSLKEGYAKFGFTITSSDKTDNIEVKNLFTCQFLKHTFSKVETDEGKMSYVAQPLTSIVYQLFNWVSTESKLGIRQQFLVNIENAFRFSFWKGRNFYEQTRKKFNDSAEQLGFSWDISYDEMAVHIKQHQMQEEFINSSVNPLDRIDRLEDIDADFDDDMSISQFFLN